MISHCVQIESDELLPNFIRHMFTKKSYKISINNQKMEGETRLVYLIQRLRLLWGRVLQNAWGGKRWDSLENIRKCRNRKNEQLEMAFTQSPIETVQTQTKQLCRDMKNLTEKNTQMEQLCREVKNLTEKNSQIEQLLLTMAKKQGIHLDPERQLHL